MSQFDEIYIPSLPLAERVIQETGSPAFLTHFPTVLNRFDKLRDSFPGYTKLYYAMKANCNPDLLKQLRESGVDGIDAVSPFEVRFAQDCGFSPERIIFTGNYSSRQELKEIHDGNILCNIGSLSELQTLGQIAPNSPVSIRLNPAVGAGEFEGTITGGENSKFGIPLEDLGQTLDIIDQHRLKLKGLHCHIGSGFYQTKEFETAVCSVLRVAEQVIRKNHPLTFIDCGGGFGVRYLPGREPIDLTAFAQAIGEPIRKFQNQYGKLEIYLEPGKFLVAESTALLCQVTAVNHSKNSIFVGTDTGFNHLIRPAFYGAYHHAVNLTGIAENRSEITATLVGNICESSDILVKKLSIAEPREGDIVALLTAGAYCSSMSSLYNLRPYPGEVIVLEGEDEKAKLKISRKKNSYQELKTSLGYSL